MFFRPIIAKLYVEGDTEELVDERAQHVWDTFWEPIHDAPNGSLYVTARVFVPEDDVESFRARANYFIYHAGSIQLPWILKYPKENVLPPCKYCDGTGEFDPNASGKGGC